MTGSGEEAVAAASGSTPPTPGMPTVQAAPATPGVPVDPARLAEHFPQLEIFELLGQGGMGSVFRARQKGLDRVVALKLLTMEGRPERFAERFGREARALARLSHTNIVTVHDSGEANGFFYFVMEYVDGLNLRQLLEKCGGRLAPGLALRIVTEVCEALEYAHEEGIIHRDIKPENILLDRKGRAKIADFGLAKLLAPESGRRSDHTLTQSHQVMGTLHYMAPEQTERPLDVDHRADIYALGVVFYEMLTGELPLGRFSLPSELGHGNGRLDQIVLRALEKDPGRRFQRASEIKTAVGSALGKIDTVEASGPAAPPPPPAAAETAIRPATSVHVPPSELPTGPALVPGATPPPMSPTPARTTAHSTSLHIEPDFERAYEQVLGPANCMFLGGVMSLVLHLTPAVVIGIIMLAGGGDPGALKRVMILLLAASAAAVGIMYGAQRMKRLERRSAATLACLLSVMPLSTICWIVYTLPVGIWGFMVLNRRDVSAAFEAKRRELERSAR